MFKKIKILGYCRYILKKFEVCAKIEVYFNKITYGGIMKKFFGEFKTFITRGNVVDMAVGVIVGGAFTAIVNGLSNFVLKPVINWLLALILGKGTLSEVYTFLGTPARLEDGTIDLANSFYIDWGAFINAVINFFIVAFVLFTIVKIINKLRESGKMLENEIFNGGYTKQDRKAMKKLGVNIKDEAAVAAYFEKKKQDEAEAKAAAEAKAKADREANPTTEDLLKKILAVLEEK